MINLKYLNIDNLLASYNPKDNIKIQLDYISSSFISQKQSRELFQTNKDFLLLKCLIKNNKTLDIESNFGTITINISYQDIISFLQCYLLNKILKQNINSIIKTQKEKSNQNQDGNLKQRPSVFNSVATIIDSQKNSFVKLKLFLNNIYFTLIDNSSSNYQPF